MKKFYELSLSSEPADIGVTNGVTQARFDKTCFNNPSDFDKVMTYFGRDNILFMNKIDKLEKTIIQIPHLKLLNNAKLTDILGFGPYLMDANYLISLKFKNILDKFSLQTCKFFKTELWAKNGKVGDDYFFLYMPVVEDSDIIFSRSQMYTGSFQKNYIDLKSQEDYEKYRSAMEGFSRICLKKEYSNLDFIYLGITMQWYISKDLKDAIEDFGLTGTEFSNADIIFEN